MICGTSSMAAEFEDAIKQMGNSKAEGTIATKNVYELIGEAKDLFDNKLNMYASKFKKKIPDLPTAGRFLQPAFIRKRSD